MAKLKGYSTKSYPESKSFIDELISGYEDNIKTKAIKEEIGEAQWQVLQQVRTVKQIMGKTQARLPIFVVNHP